MNHFSRRRSFFRSLVVATFFALAALPSAFASEASDATALANSGKLTEALSAADKYLDKHPNDASMLFLKGMILAQQKQHAQAIAVFTRLTEKHPSLPEAYNNLAVLYAAEGQYDKARASLEAGLRTNPAYATTYENLGAVYAKLASQAYERALQTRTPQPRAIQLALVRTLATGEPGQRTQTTLLAEAPKAPAPAAVVASAPAPAAVKPEPAPKPEPKPAPKPAAPSSADSDAVAQALHDWAKAWSNKDVNKYLGHYASDFKPPQGKSRKAWADERRSRIVGKGRISVKVESPQITVSGNTATVKFKQSYSSDRLSVSSRKTMIFTKTNGQWKIKQEQSN